MINKYSRINKHWHLHHAYVHTHGAIDPSVFTTQRGIWANKWSFFGLLATAISSVFLFLLQSSESYWNLARVFLPGMFVKAFIEIADNSVNTLPEQAIVRSGGKHYIYILKGKRIENNQEMSDFEMIEIQKGVTEGLYVEVALPDSFDINSSQIVLKGAYSLLSKMKVSGEEGGHGH